MPDREKVMAGLVTCIAACNGKTVCLDCGYMHDYSGGCETQLLSDALALLKQQAQALTDINADLQESIADNLRLQELVNAQVPVKPTRYQEGRWFKTWRCGACGRTLMFRNGEEKPNYCTDCGRRVKWG